MQKLSWFFKAAKGVKLTVPTYANRRAAHQWLLGSTSHWQREDKRLFISQNILRCHHSFMISMVTKEEVEMSLSGWLSQHNCHPFRPGWAFVSNNFISIWKPSSPSGAAQTDAYLRSFPLKPEDVALKELPCPPHLWHEEVPRPGIEPAMQLRPVLQLWQQILTHCATGKFPCLLLETHMSTSWSSCPGLLQTHQRQVFMHSKMSLRGFICSSCFFPTHRKSWAGRASWPRGSSQH